MTGKKVFIIIPFLCVAGFLFICYTLFLISKSRNEKVSLKDKRDSNAEITYVPIGDSYTIGNDVAEANRWPNVLTSNLRNEGIPVTLVENPAVSGYTVRDAIEIELPIIEKVKPQFVTVLIGANDNFAQRSTQTFQNDLDELLDKLQVLLPNPENILLITIPDYSRSPAARSYDTTGVTELVEDYNDLIKEEAEKRNLQVADIFPVSQTMTTEEDFTSDGLHPSAAGYAKWEKIILPVAREILKKAE